MNAKRSAEATAIRTATSASGEATPSPNSDRTMEKLLPRPP